MDRKEAIRRIEDHMESHRIGEYPHIKLKTAIEMAIAALSDREFLDRSRWDGCEWCYDEIPFDSDDMELELQHPLEDEPRMVRPQFCPMCGRPLGEQAWSELERRLNFPGVFDSPDAPGGSAPGLEGGSP